MGQPTFRPKQLPKLILLLAALALNTANAGDTRDLKFITIEVAPWASINPDTGEPEGAFIEVVNGISERTGYNISTTLTPFARVEREMESGGHDCTVLVPRDEEVVARGELVSYHDVGVIPHKKITLKEYGHLHGLKISLLRGSEITPEFDTDDDLRKEYATDYLISLRKLGRERIDAIAGAMPTILFLAHQNNLAEFLGEPLKLTEIPLIFQCSLKSENIDVMPEINQAIRAMHEDGTMNRIKDDYYF